MAAEAPRAPLSVYMLADHLDAALAAGEDLIARGHAWHQLVAAPGNMQTFPARQRAIVEDIRAYELMTIARLLKARDHARALAQFDQRFAPVANLFAAGTATLLDAVEECGDATADDFETGDAVLAYMRSRGLIPVDAPAIKDAAQLTIDDTFLVAKRAQLGTLLDMAGSFIDALEVRYELYADEETADAALEAASEQALEDAAEETAAAEPSETKQASDPQSPLSRLYSKGIPRREFGQRHRTPLN
jgi:hypothetical protein